MSDLSPPFDRKTKGQWVQTERKAHEAWAALIRKSPMAAQIMHLLTAQVGDGNAVLMSQKNLARLVQGSERGVRDALKLLSNDNWIEIRQVGGRGTVNAYIINDRVAWSGKRDGIRYSLFSANVVVSDDEQPDAQDLGKQEPLRRLPMAGENQLPAGPGLPPPSQMFLNDMEPELPASGAEENDPLVRVVKNRHYNLREDAYKYKDEPGFNVEDYALGVTVEYEMVPLSKSKDRERA